MPEVPICYGLAGQHAVPTDPPCAVILALESVSMATAPCVGREWFPFASLATSALCIACVMFAPDVVTWCRTGLDKKSLLPG